MSISFSKYHGTGNDFILIDNRDQSVQLTTVEISALCNRRTGIGSDGLIYILSSSEYDFEMKYFNADGNEGTMCGNGGRCITAFANDLGIIKQDAHFKAIDGDHKGIIHSAHQNDFHIEISINDMEVNEQPDSYYFLNTGSPHYVEFVENIENVDVKNKGKEIRWDPCFQPGGTNVNFVEIGKDILKVKTFERGVEDITLSCGTGVTAAAIAADLKLNDNRSNYNIITLGGPLNIKFDRNKQTYTNIMLSGPVVKVFEGTIKL